MSEFHDRQLAETLFKTIKALCTTDSIITDYHQYNWFKFLTDIHQMDVDSEFINIFSDDTTEKILSIRKPAFEVCPKPPATLIEWLQPGWDRYKAEVTVHKQLEHKKEFFADSASREREYHDWLRVRTAWVQRQLHLERIDKLFASFNKIHDVFRVDSEQYELLFAFGIFQDVANSAINHPLFNKRIRIEYSDVKNNVITLYDTEAEVHFDSTFLTKLPEGSVNNFGQVNALLVDDCSIFDVEQMKDLSKHAIHYLSVKGEYYEEEVKFHGNNRFVVTLKPMLILRVRPSGMANFLDKIIEDIQTGCVIPQHLVALLNPKDQLEEQVLEEPEMSIDERLASVSGEDPEIYMTKPANREQLRIAKEIERHTAVEVQGPPGTGKTHTIANLIGHFLAQGKTLLVTSEKVKALTVLRDKLDDEIKPLCVPVFYDNQSEMQYSVNAILSKQGETSVGELQRKIDQCQQERKDIISRLNAERRAVFQIRNKEAKDIVFAHQSYSVMEAAQFVADHKDLLQYIPGPVERIDELPLSIERFQFMYRSNADISLVEERELALELPDYTEFISPETFIHLLETIHTYEAQANAIMAEHDNTFEVMADGKISYEGEVLFGNPNPESLSALAQQLKEKFTYSSWQLTIISDSFIGGGYEQRWNALIQKAEEYSRLDKDYMGDAVGTRVEFVSGVDLHKLQTLLPDVVLKIQQEGKISSFYKMFHGNAKFVLNNILIDGHEISNEREGHIALLKINRDIVGLTLKHIWDDLFAGTDISLFDTISGNRALYVSTIAGQVKAALDWKCQYYQPLKTALESVEFNMRLFGVQNDFATDISNRLQFIAGDLQEYVEIALIHNAKTQIQHEIEKTQSILQTEQFRTSALCQGVLAAIKGFDGNEYQEAYKQYKQVIDKRKLYKDRLQFIDELRPYADDWATAIVKRLEAQAVNDVPCDLNKAWMVKQLHCMLAELFAESIDKRQNNILIYGKDLRNKTSEVAGLMAWRHLLHRLSGRQAVTSALNSWSTFMKKIGKGTGKMAATYRKSARRNMLQGQEAVPAWIIPVKKVLETFDPVKNHFDIAIVDEASQSSLEALAITFMADKIIVVGDDKQVSPMLVGKAIEPRKAILSNMLSPYTNNWAMFDGETSFYELVGTVFQPLMLREHFRCVPEIIGYSNEKFYNNQILPLRDSNLCRVTPPVVSYRTDGRREGKQKLNRIEAEAIVSLIQACCEQEEYSGKTFGVISLLGEEQAEYINSLISQHITDYGVIQERDLICGDSPSFQGDERDVIFLSMVDDNDTIRKKTGGNDAKRYNVAASRAKDQLWVVHSLDYSLLQQDDLHYGLLEYAQNYQTHQQNLDSVKIQADSVFEEEVAKYLLAQGYHITQQYAVGAYRLDIVVHYKTKKIAIECDGQRYHSGEEKIRQDMERQCILERLGYRFVRIGGGQFYRDKEATMQLVFTQLAEAGIYPEVIHTDKAIQDDELYLRVTRRAGEIRKSWENEGDSCDEIGCTTTSIPEPVINGSNGVTFSQVAIDGPMQVAELGSNWEKQVSQSTDSQSNQPSNVDNQVLEDSRYSKFDCNKKKFVGKLAKKDHVDAPVVSMDDYVSIKSLATGDEKKYLMVCNSLGHLTELARVCIGRHLDDLIEYQGGKYKIVKITHQ